MRRGRNKLAGKAAGIMLSIFIVAAFMPVLPESTETAYAGTTADKVCSDVGGIGNPTSTSDTAAAWTGDYVYFGTYNSDPVKFRVLNKNETSFGGSTMLLDSNYTLKEIKFRADNSSNIWAGSDLEEWMNGTEAGQFLNGFTSGEQDAVFDSVKPEASGAGSLPRSSFGYGPLKSSGEKVFALDSTEASYPAYGYSNDNTRKKYGTDFWWWMRSFDIYNYNLVSMVVLDGSTGSGQVTLSGTGAAPALNVALSSVVFSSAASGGKSDFAQTAANTSGAWKLTLADSRDMSEGTGISGTGTSGNTVRLLTGYSADELTVTHKKLSELSPDYTDLTAALTDSSGDILYYGSVDDDTSSESSELTIPSGLPAGSYGLKIYGEDWNGDYRTDYATGTPYTAAVTVTDPVDASVAPASAVFDKYEPADIDITKSDGTFTLDAVKTGTDTLERDTDYTVSGNTVTLKKIFLDGLSEGAHTITFDYNGGNDPSLELTVENTAPERSVTVLRSAGGQVQVSPDSAKVGTVITVDAVPGTGYRLKSITADGSTVTGNTFVMPDRNVIVAAAFVKKTYNIKGVSSSKKKGRVTGSGTVKYGDGAILKAKARKGFYLAEWTKNGRKAGTGTTLKIKKVKADATYKAVFRKLPVIFKVSGHNGTAVSIIWKPVRGAAGYQIANNDTAGKTMKVKWTGKNSINTYTSINKLRGRTYKFRMRYYRIAGGKKVWSRWTPARLWRN